MGKTIDLTGKRFGRLVVIGKSKKRYSFWFCQCDCGNLACVRGDNLRNGGVRSCGCLHKEAHTTHGKSRTKIYKAWYQMCGRCDNPRNNRYEGYGARGIKVCERWKKFENFYADMGDCPEGCSIERVDNDGDYCPENCKWIPKNHQQLNTRGKGYSWDKHRQMWYAYINLDGKRTFLGRFEMEEEAAAEYQKAKVVRDLIAKSALSGEVL